MSNEYNYAEDLKQAVETLRKGGVILYPTDTIWGLGCDASNSDAIKRIYEIKKRQQEKSLILLVDGIASLERCVGEIPEAAEQLIEAAVNPLTIIYDAAVGVDANAVADDGSVAVRITNEKFSNDLCRRFRRPIVSTSANISNSPAPRNFSEISQEIIDSVDYVVRFRQEDMALENASNIIKVSNSNEIKIIR